MKAGAAHSVRIAPSLDPQPRVVMVRIHRLPTHSRWSSAVSGSTSWSINAGHGLYALLTDATEEQFDSLIDTHLRGPVFLAKKLLPSSKMGGAS